MRQFASATVSTVALFLFSCASSHAADLDARYALALRTLSPELSRADARLLAATTLREADRFGLDARLVVALIAVESSWQPAAISPAGARGLGQLMPGTATELGVDPSDPSANVRGTARYLRMLLDRYRGFPMQPRFERAIAAYNAGPGAVDAANGIPQFSETQHYVRRVIALWRKLAGS